MTINKKNIAKSVSKSLSISLDDSLNFLESFLSVIKVNSKKKKVKISIFGTFHYKKTIQRIGRNPKTRESYIIDSYMKPRFRASKKIKEILN